MQSEEADFDGLIILNVADRNLFLAEVFDVDILFEARKGGTLASELCLSITVTVNHLILG